MGYKRSAREHEEDLKHSRKITTKLGIKGMLNIGFIVVLLLLVAIMFKSS